MLDKSKSSVQDTKSTRNRTSVFTTELNKRVHESKQCTYSVSVYPYLTESHYQKSWTFRARDKMSAESHFQNGGQNISPSGKTYTLRYFK